MATVVLVHGLPGSGKTTLADLLGRLIPNSARINADQIRATISADLKFSLTDRKLQAYRLGCISGIALLKPIQVVGGALEGTSHLNDCVVVDFVNPTEETRATFRWALRSTLVTDGAIRLVEVWMNTLDSKDSRFQDTNKLYVKPSVVDYTVEGWKTPEELAAEAEAIVAKFFTQQKFL